MPYSCVLLLVAQVGLVLPVASPSGGPPSNVAPPEALKQASSLSSERASCCLRNDRELAISIHRAINWKVLDAAYYDASSGAMITEGSASSRSFGVDHSIVLRQQLVAASNGRLELHREYEKLESLILSQRDSWRTKGASLLVGQGVVFDVGTPDKGPAYAHLSRGPEKLIAGLLFDACLCAIIPDGGLVVGAEWELGKVELRSVLQPGGQHYIVPNSSRESRYGPDGLPGILALGHELSYSSGAVQGQLLARTVEVLEEDGRSQAIVAIEICLECKAPLSGPFKSAIKMAEGCQSGEEEVVAGASTLDWKSEEVLSGTMTWDLASKRLCKLSLEGRVDLELRLNAAIPGLGYRPEMPVVYFARLEGEISQEVRVRSLGEGSR